MSSDDFAAAQQRLQTRRQQRERDYHARLAMQHDSQHQQRIAALPYPLSRLGATGLTLWEAVKGREGTRPVFRVGQVDAELLDEELLELLKGQVAEGLKCFGPNLADEYKAEIMLLLRMVLFKLTIWDHNASYGAALQGLRYTDARTSNPARPPPRRWQKSVYGLVTVGGRYAWARWQDWLTARTGGYEPPVARVRLAERLTNGASVLHSIAAFASFLIFLGDGRCRTLLDRALGLRLVPTAAGVAREVSFEYLNRQLVWHAFTEFLLFLLPLVGVARWRRILTRAWRRLRSFLATSFGRKHHCPEGNDVEGGGGGGALGKAGELGFLPERTCAICYSDQNPAAGASEQQVLSQSAMGGSGVVGSAATDITNPYQAEPCGCVYCFVCLAQRIEAEEGEGWICLRCGQHPITSCRPWDGDVIVDRQKEQRSVTSAGGVKSVGFATEDEKRSLRQMSPATELRENEAGAGGAPLASTKAEHGLVGSGVLGDSEEWARASRVVDDDGHESSVTSTTSDGSDDEQSEEIDEEEDEIEVEE